MNVDQLSFLQIPQIAFVLGDRSIGVPPAFGGPGLFLVLAPSEV